ncbi:MAG TPA: hypothetical protein VK466_08235, partial [Terriglobales bacterium]|nr:hypothetical protein [Terriglobales bacterium]
MLHLPAFTVLWFLLVFPSIALPADDFTLTGQVVRIESSRPKDRRPRGDVVVWLTPLDNRLDLHPVAKQDSAHLPRLVQRDKHFEPHLLVIPAG